MKTLIVALGLSLAALSMQAQAATFSLNDCLTGACGGNGSAATYSVNQAGSNVNFSLSNTIDNLTNTNSGSFVGYFEFVSKEANLTYTDFANLQIGGNVRHPVYTLPSDSTHITISRLDLNGFTDAGYKYNVKFDFSTANNQWRFVDGETISWTINNALENSFVFDGHPLAAVHIQGLDGGQSVKYGTSAVPVPAAAWLFGSALLGLTGMSRRKKAATTEVVAA